MVFTGYSTTLGFYRGKKDMKLVFWIPRKQFGKLYNIVRSKTSGKYPHITFMSAFHWLCCEPMRHRHMRYQHHWRVLHSPRQTSSCCRWQRPLEKEQNISIRHSIHRTTHSALWRFVVGESLEPSDSRLFASGETGIGFEEPDRRASERRESFESVMCVLDVASLKLLQKDNTLLQLDNFQKFVIWS